MRSLLEESRQFVLRAHMLSLFFCYTRDVTFLNKISTCLSDPSCSSLSSHPTQHQQSAKTRLVLILYYTSDVLVFFLIFFDFHYLFLSPQKFSLGSSPAGLLWARRIYV